MAFPNLRILTKRLREEGVTATLKSVGWKVGAVIFAYYLVRDITLYILIPWWVARRISAS